MADNFWLAIAVVLVAISVVLFVGAIAGDRQCRAIVKQAQHASQPFVAEWVKTSEACH